MKLLEAIKEKIKTRRYNKKYIDIGNFVWAIDSIKEVSYIEHTNNKQYKYHIVVNTDIRTVVRYKDKLVAKQDFLYIKRKLFNKIF